jgi:hypothetical protein
MRQSLKRIARIPLAPAIAAMFGLIALTLISMTPGWLLERLVSAAGLAAVFPAAQPPLGSTARILCAVFGGIGVFVLLWAALSPLQALVRKRRPQKAKGSRIGAAPTVSPAHAMKRPPIFAERELGAPFMSDEAIAATIDTSAASGGNAEHASAMPALDVMPTPAAVAISADPERAEDNVSPLADEMARLEAALVRRNARGVVTRPRAASDPVQLRSVLHHMG